MDGQGGRWYPVQAQALVWPMVGGNLRLRHESGADARRLERLRKRGSCGRLAEKSMASRRTWCATWPSGGAAGNFASRRKGIATSTLHDSTKQDSGIGATVPQVETQRLLDMVEVICTAVGTDAALPAEMWPRRSGDILNLLRGCVSRRAYISTTRDESV